jgi:hypothetical protein
MPGPVAQLELALKWAGGLVGQWTEGSSGNKERGTPNLERGTRNGPGSHQLIARLMALGLPQFKSITTHRNEQVMLSWGPGRVLRIHEGYAAAPDEVLQAIVRFVTPGVRRATRLAAKRIFLDFPVDDHAPRPVRPPRPRRVPPADRPVLARLEMMHQELNRKHFAGGLRPITIRLSSRMRSRLGELRLSRKTGAPLHIGISKRHIRRDGWDSVTDTLLHEMVHQWQAETGRTVNHGREFRAKARAVGIEARAVRRDW